MYISMYKFVNTRTYVCTYLCTHVRIGLVSHACHMSLTCSSSGVIALESGILDESRENGLRVCGRGHLRSICDNNNKQTRINTDDDR